MEVISVPTLKIHLRGMGSATRNEDMGVSSGLAFNEAIASEHASTPKVVGNTLTFGALQCVHFNQRVGIRTH